MKMRLMRPVAIVALAALAFAAAPAHGATAAPSGFPVAQGAISVEGGASHLRALRAVAQGQQPETTPLGDVLLAEDEQPRRLATGVRATFFVADVDGDGDDDLVQLTGTFSHPRLTLSDGATGTVLWETPLSTANFLLRLVPAGAGQDVLVITGEGSFFAQKMSGTSGGWQWRRPLPEGDRLHLLGIAAAGEDHDFVVGLPTFRAPQMLGFDVEYRSLANGRRTGGIDLTGEGQFPTAALAGDLDGDAVDDLFAYEPLYLFGAGTSGWVRAVTGRGDDEQWSTTFLHDVSDYTWMLAGADVNGDGTNDAVLLSDFLGLFGSGQTSTITVVDGNGGTSAGVRPLEQVLLHSYAQTYTQPSDVNGDGRQEMVFSGAVYTSTTGKIVFEAIGGGVLWRTSVDYPVDDPGRNFGYGWYADAGDLDGDGAADALAVVGTKSGGPQEAVAVSQASGTHLWRAQGLDGAFPLPAEADLDGDGADDLLDGVRATHPTFSTTRIEFSAVRGIDRTPLWAHARTLGMRTGYLVWAAGVRDGATDDVVVEYNVMAGRHFAESLDGSTATVNWTSP